MTPDKIIEKVYEEVLEAATRQLFQVLILKDGAELWNNHAEAKRHFQIGVKGAAIARKQAIDLFHELLEGNK